MTDISYTRATTKDIPCPKCKTVMTGGAVTKKLPGKPETVAIRCRKCGRAFEYFVER